MHSMSGSLLVCMWSTRCGGPYIDGNQMSWSRRRKERRHDYSIRETFEALRLSHDPQTWHISIPYPLQLKLLNLCRSPTLSLFFLLFSPYTSLSTCIHYEQYLQFSSHAVNCRASSLYMLSHVFVFISFRLYALRILIFQLVVHLSIF